MEENGLVGVTTDMWTDSKNCAYLSLTVHFVLESALRSSILSVEKFLGDYETAENVKKHIINCLISKAGC